MSTRLLTCRACGWTTPVKYRTKRGKLVDGWSRLVRHAEDEHHADVTPDAVGGHAWATSEIEAWEEEVEPVEDRLREFMTKGGSP